MKTTKTQRDAAAEFLAQGLSARQAATKSGISESTIKRLKADKEFSDGVATRRKEILQELRDNVVAMGATALGTFQRAMTGKDEKGNPLSPSSKVTTAGIKAAEHILRKLGAIGDEGPAVSINVKQARVVRYNPAGSSDPETDDAE